MRGERSGVRYGVGARVRVQVSRVDLDSRKIDFRIVREPGEARPIIPSGKKRRGGDVSAVAELDDIREQDRAVKRAAKDAVGRRRAGEGAAPSRDKARTGAKKMAGKKAPRGRA